MDIPEESINLMWKYQMAKLKTIGDDADSGQPVLLGDRERRSGLYILGRSGMGKTNLLVNLIVQAIENSYGLFFLDPHDGIDCLKSVYERHGQLPSFIELNIQNETHSFGINLLKCKNVDSWTERGDTYDRARWVFFKLFEKEFGEKPWLESIIQNTLYVFIENQEYTLAEVPHFLINPDFRNYLVSKVRYKPDVVDFWKYHFHPRQAESALTRMTTLLGHDAVRHIVGQKETTLDFLKVMEERRIVLVKLPTTLAPDIKKFIGTILISELLHAVRSRPEDKRKQFCIFVDEFQHFVNYEDFGILITEARKYGIATTIVHQERFGQLGDNKQIIGATDATVNKVFFRLSVRDAQEQAPEFAKEPPVETKLEPEYVISQEPFFHLLRGHPNLQIREFVNTHLRPLYYEMENIRARIEPERIKRMDYIDEASLYRLDQGIEGADPYYKRPDVMAKSLQKAEHSVEQARDITPTILSYHARLDNLQRLINQLNMFFTMIMERKITPGSIKEDKKEFTWSWGLSWWFTFLNPVYDEGDNSNVFWIYTRLLYDNPNAPQTLLASIMHAHKLYLNEVPDDLGFIRPVVNSAMRERVLKACLEEFYRFEKSSGQIASLIDKYFQFCQLLAKPENHIRVASGKYFEKAVHTRQVHDMSDEMAQELASLPQFTAYAKVIAEKEGEQTVWKGKIKTLPLPSWGELKFYIDPPAREDIHKFCKRRDLIEEEIHQRQKRWRSDILDEAPPTHT
jgi:hypothetical protein